MPIKGLICRHVLHAKSLQSCLTLEDPKNCSPPGSSVHGISQVRPLEWVAMTSSRESCQPRDQTCIFYVSCIGRWVLYHECHLGSPIRKEDRCKDCILEGVEKLVNYHKLVTLSK